MKKLMQDEKGMIIVEAVYVLPIVILITISLYFLTMFLYGRISLQESVTWYAEVYCNMSRNATIETVVDTDAAITSPKNPYRLLFENVTKGSESTFVESVDSSSQKKSPDMWATGIQAKVGIEGVIFKNVVATASRTFAFPINLSFIGLPSEVSMSVSVRRPITDHDELIRNVDMAVDLSSYLDDKYGISDSIKEMMSKVSGFISRIMS